MKQDRKTSHPMMIICLTWQHLKLLNKTRYTYSHAYLLIPHAGVYFQLNDYDIVDDVHKI